jgi:hypothetical protein
MKRIFRGLLLTGGAFLLFEGPGGTNGEGAAVLWRYLRCGHRY